MNSKVVVSHPPVAVTAAPVSSGSVRGGDIGRLLSAPGNPERVMEALESATADQLAGFGLNAYRISLVSLFGDAWPSERIERAALDAARSKLWGGWLYHHDYLPSLARIPDAPRIEDAPIDRIRELLALGRGLLVVTFHLGHMRFLASDVAHGGLSITMPLAGDAYRDYSCAQANNPEAAVWAAMRYVNVEENGGALAIARVMARGGIVFSTIDGNTGMDGPRGDERRGIVRIHARRAKVKDGLFRMAARFGSPILPLVAVTVDGRMRCLAGELQDPGCALVGEAADHFVERGLQSAYDLFSSALADHPGDWCGGDLFHQWRVPEAIEPLDSDVADATLMRSFGTSAKAVLNRARMVSMPDKDGLLWTDALSMRCYRFPSDLVPLAIRLEGPGVAGEWLDAQGESLRARARTMMRQLLERHAIRLDA